MQQITKQPKEGGSHFGLRFETVVFVSAFVGFVGLMSAIGWWFNEGYADTMLIQSENTKNKTAEQIQAETQVIGDIRYNARHQPVLKTLFFPEEMNTQVSVLNIGTITNGPFAGDTLALAISLRLGPNPAVSVPVDPYEYRANSYVFFVSDEMGIPIAWDPQYIRLQCTSCQTEQKWQSVLGFSDSTKTDLSGILPEELANIRDVYTYKTLGTFRGNTSLIPGGHYPEAHVGTTTSGFPMMWAGYGVGIDPYYVVLPFGYYIGMYPFPDFLDVGSDVRRKHVPRVQWTEGDGEIDAEYYWYVGAASHCYRDQSDTDIRATLIQTGVTVHGYPVYETDSNKYPDVYQCLFERAQILYHFTQVDEYPYTYEEFIRMHPLFFWEHSTAGLMSLHIEHIIDPNL